MTAEILGYWAPEETVTMAGAPKVHSLVLWPTGKISGSFKAQDSKEKLPEGFEIRLDAPPSKPGVSVPKGSVRCSVGEAGAWTCEIPAGKLDVAVRVTGFIPHYRWDLDVQKGDTLPLGAMILKRGASLAGWVEVEDGALEAGKCIARLAPLLAPGPGSPGLDARLRSTVIEQPVNKKGFFQLESIAPGTYQVEVRQPGFAPARAFPLQVWERSETALKQPLVLRRPLTLELVVSPPLDWLDRPWKILLQRRSDFSAGVEPDSIVERSPDREGRLQVSGQTAGRFFLQVSDSQGTPFFAEPYLQIGGPEDVRQLIEIDLVSLQGKVLLGEEPLSATLWFGGRFGSVRAQVKSDSEGEFRGVLPRDGSWNVQIRSENPPLDTHAKVDVKANEKGEAAVEIVLPDTLLYGKVLDDGGRPVPKARVFLNSLIDHVETEAGEDGAYELRAVPEGRVELTAEASSPEGSLTSDEIVVEAVDSQPAGPINLVLRKTKAFAGRIRSARGPVAGATVTVWPLRPAMGLTQTGRTGLDGRFSMKVPGKAEMLAVVVSPPGGALKAFQVPSISDPIVLQVPDDGGELEVHLPLSMEAAASKGYIVTVTQDGISLTPSVLHRWAEGHGMPFFTPTGVRAPRLAAGQYEVCFGPATIMESAEVTDWKSQRAACASGYLGEGAGLSLDLRKKD